MMFRGTVVWLRLAIGTLMFVSLLGCQSELVNGLSQRQANETLALLLRNGIDAKKQDVGKGRFRIDVDREDFPDAVRLLDKYQLPSRDDIAIADLFPADSFVNSPTTERARLISGLEQRLEQTVKVVEHVLSARVHISYPMSERVAADQDLHVSLMLNYDGPLADAILIQRLKQLIKNSFSSLSYENISVVIFHVDADQSDGAIFPDAVGVGRGANERWPIIACAAALVLIGAGVLVHIRRRRKSIYQPEAVQRAV